MNNTETVNLAICRCQTCNERIEFKSEQAGETIACPHCGIDTKLYVVPVVPAPAPPVVKPKRDLGKIVGYLTFIVLTGVVVFAALRTVLVSRPNGSELSQGVLVLLALCAGVFLYFLPSIVGRKKRNAQAILTLNLLLGWTSLDGRLLWCGRRQRMLSSTFS